MRHLVRAAWLALPVLLGVAMGETTVAAMQVEPASNDYAPPPEPQDRYSLGHSWAAKHHLGDANACPAIDALFQSGCIAATRY
jgi:hypothetical protein